MSKEAKSNALKGRLVNNIGYCPECGHKHKKGEHDEEKTEKKHGKEEEKEEEEDGEE